MALTRRDRFLFVTAPEGWPLYIVLVKVAYSTASITRFFFSKLGLKLCSFLKIWLLFLSKSMLFKTETQNDSKLYLCVDKAWNLHYFELHTYSDKKSLSTPFNSRLEAVTPEFPNVRSSENFVDCRELEPTQSLISFSVPSPPDDERLSAKYLVRNCKIQETELWTEIENNQS